MRSRGSTRKRYMKNITRKTDCFIGGCLMSQLCHQPCQWFPGVSNCQGSLVGTCLPWETQLQLQGCGAKVCLMSRSTWGSWRQIIVVSVVWCSWFSVLVNWAAVSRVTINAMYQCVVWRVLASGLTHRGTTTWWMLLVIGETGWHVQNCAFWYDQIPIFFNLFYSTSKALILGVSLMFPLLDLCLL